VDQGGTLITLENTGSITSHVIGVWVDSSTSHQRFEADLFVNSGETWSQAFPNINLPSGDYTVKVTTERGNISILSMG
jgi:hypothetical protein